MNEPRANDPAHDIPDYRNIYKDPDGTWHASHRVTGEPIEAADWPTLVNRACAARIRQGIEQA